MLVERYAILKIEPKLDVEPFKQYTAEIKLLLSEREEHVVEIDLVGITESIANAIRRTAIEELELKALSFDTTTVQTNIDYIILDELFDRIHAIPIKQDIPDDAEISLNVFNNSNDNGIQVVYSSDLVGADKGKVPGKFQLAEMRPGNYLKIPRIFITKGYGNEDAMYGLTSNYFYDNLDYMDVMFINLNGNRITKRVRVADVLERCVEHKLKQTARGVWEKKILVIPDKNYEKLIKPHEQTKIAMAKYDITLRATTTGADKEYIAERSSLMSGSTEFRMKYYLGGQIDPEQFMTMVCDSLISRLVTVKTGLESILAGIVGGKAQKTKLVDDTSGIDTTGRVVVTTRPVEVTHEDQKITVQCWNMTIFGETHTIGELIVFKIYELDPDVPQVKKKMEHPRDTQVTIEIIHPSASKLCMDAINACIKTFEQIKSATLPK